ncbi:O-linked N-acetylglucosamine transferase, SPINDLY family protein [Synechococcus sp. LTW-G]
MQLLGGLRPSFFLAMWFEHLFQWPDELPEQISVPQLSLEAVAIDLRQCRYLEAERRLRALAVCRGLISSAELLLAQACLSFSRGQFASVLSLLEAPEFQETDAPLRRLLFYMRVNTSLQHSRPIDPSWMSSRVWACDLHWPPFLTTQAAIALRTGQLDQCSQLLQSLVGPLSLEAVRLKSALLIRRQQAVEGSQLLEQAVQRAPLDLELRADYLNSLLEARSQQGTIPAAREALARFGEHPRLLGSLCTIKLLQRQPSLALRAGLAQRLSQRAVALDGIRLSNLFVGYEQTGHPDWMQFLSAQALESIAGNLSLQENRCLQLASVQSDLAPEQTRQVVNSYNTLPLGQPWRPEDCPRSAPDEPLRIGWVTGDVCQHPVARFLLGFFEAYAGRSRHTHILVNLKDHGNESYQDKFASVPGLHLLDASQNDNLTRLSTIRRAKLDLAIDLSGWTGGHFMRGFLSRLAPVQVNYLGYFASTGLPSMDAWLGDTSLFPTPMVEWSSERIVRLPRCFIAWQPSRLLDDFHARVTEAPTGDIRFGCFNHNRKLSNDVLALWGRLLSSIPGSRLVLKANASSDPYTQTLLVRRMRRVGLDPDRVIWLPLAPSHREHLEQYRHVDVALDSYPNGGCTTTCEALWMGAPVITLTGTHYVSRMSTAVLNGANLPHFCASTPEEYIAIAQDQAMRLHELRQSRDQWRRQILSSPLGDAADLMGHLEDAFSSLVNVQLASNRYVV